MLANFKDALCGINRNFWCIIDVTAGQVGQANPDCNYNGRCLNGRCACNGNFQGDYCEIQVKKSSRLLELLLAKLLEEDEE